MRRLFPSPMDSLSPSIITLFGHPNSGKTTIFNALTGLHSKTVNYPGSTVDYKEGALLSSPDIRVLDTPGIPSLIAQSEDEVISLKTLFHVDELYPEHFSPNPELVIVVLDGTRLKKQLVLLRQLQELGFNILAVLTMKDYLDEHSMELNTTVLSHELEIPCIHVNARDPKNTEVLDLLIKNALLVQRQNQPEHIPRPTTFKTPLEETFKWAENLIGLVLKKPTILVKKFDPDQVLLHPIWGLFAFGAIMTGLFWSIFSLATPIVDGLDAGFSWGLDFLSRLLPATLFSDLIINGFLLGLGSVIVFVPQIFILFFLLGALEDSGYLARGTLLIDKPLSLLGLNGKSFVPLLSGCACAIPAMMAARNIPGKKERFITMFVIPLMSCSARLPVYGLLISLLLGLNHPLLSGVMMTGVYFVSTFITLGVAGLLNRFYFKAKESSSFHIELPEYRPPIFSSIFKRAKDQTLGFIFKAGPMIVMVGIGLYILTNFPNPDYSFAHKLSHFIGPVFSPMGIDWRVGIALIFSFAAREVFVSALALVFNTGSEDGLFGALQHATHLNSQELLFTPASVIGLVFFFMISMQCLTTVAVARKEFGSWKVTLSMTVGYVSLAYVTAVAAYQLLRLFSF